MKIAHSFHKCTSMLALVVLLLFSMQLIAQPDEKQVMLETELTEVNTCRLDEMGLSFGLGPAMSWYTNDKFDNRKVAVGLLATAMLYMRFNQYFGISNGLYFGQYGFKSKYESNVFQSMINTLGLITMANLYLARRVEPSLGVGFLLGANVCGVQRHKFDGDKHKDKIKFTDNDNRFFAALVVSVMVTTRTNIGDFGTGIRVSTGLTTLQKDPVERKVPVLLDIPLVYTLFSSKKQQDRQHLFLIKPNIISSQDDEEY